MYFRYLLLFFCICFSILPDFFIKNMQRTLVLIKPDAIQRGLFGNITSRFEQKGLKLVGCKMIALGDEILQEHYAHVADKPFFTGMRVFMKSTPIIALCWEGKDAVDVVRLLCGATNAREADVGTIRGDLSMSIQCNAVHTSDSLETAKNEVERFFSPEEIFQYKKDEYLHLYTEDEAKHHE
jgi:nucleoside-diphosphate kinase